MNMHRSKTAELLFRDRFETKSAGIYNNHVSAAQLEWADLVVVMENHQREEISKRFPKQYMQKRIICLNIPDIYVYDQPELVAELKTKLNSHLKP